MSCSQVIFSLVVKRNRICCFRGMSISGLINYTLLLAFFLLVLQFMYALVWMRANIVMSYEYNEVIAVGVLLTESSQYDFQ